MGLIRNQGILRASDLLKYQREVEEFTREHEPKCRSYKGIERNMEEIKKKFEEPFD